MCTRRFGGWAYITITGHEPRNNSTPGTFQALAAKDQLPRNMHDLPCCTVDLIQFYLSVGETTTSGSNRTVVIRVSRDK